MKTTAISKLPIIPEEYGKQWDPTFSDTDMTKEERLFVSGLIQYYEPKSILEIGVAAGGGSANILNTILDRDAFLTSIDIAEVFNHPFVGQPIKVGENVYQEFPNLPESKWNLLLGKDPFERMEHLDTKYDFLILDTAHSHPIESLNFLAALPYLSENAIVVLHDISLYMDELGRVGKTRCFATRLLMSCICADKLLPRSAGFGGYANIVALQLSFDTRKYVRNIFDSLMLPWEAYPCNTFDVATGFIGKHYSEELREAFQEAIVLNREIRTAGERLCTNALSDLIFYGAGSNMKRFLSVFDSQNVGFNCPIWDKNAHSIKEICGHRVLEPDFISHSNGRSTVIVTVSERKVFEEVCSKLQPLGYEIFHGLREYLLLH